jgi:hypothetical protein
MQNDLDRSDWKSVHDKLVQLARTRAGLEWEEGQWLLRAFDTNVHTRLGCGSFVEYVERLFGHSPRLTMEKIRVARALEGLAEASRALREGELTWSAVRELTRVAVPETEKEWLSAVDGRSVRDVERLVSGRLPGSLPTDAPNPQAERHVLRFDVSAETRATFNEALAKLTKDAGQHLDDDALLLLMARQVLGGPADEGRASYQVTMTLCERCAHGEQRAKGESVAIEPAVVEMANCDSQVVADTHVGTRASQTIPPAVRRLVMQRDSGRCSVPGCRHSMFVDVHHLDPRAEGGGNDPDNLIVLCSAHHRALHRGQLVVAGRVSSGLEFRHADGSSYGEVKSLATADTSAKVFQALRNMGFREKETRQAVERANTHVGVAAPIEALLRRALQDLTSNALACARR